MSIREQDLACGRCEVMQQFEEDQDEARFSLECRPAACQLNRWLNDENAQTWRWFLELIAMQDAKLEATVDGCFRDTGIEFLRAFVTFRSVYLAGMHELAAQEHDQGKEQSERAGIRRLLTEG